MEWTGFGKSLARTSLQRASHALGSRGSFVLPVEWPGGSYNMSNGLESHLEAWWIGVSCDMNWDLCGKDWGMGRTGVEEWTGIAISDTPPMTKAMLQSPLENTATYIQDRRRSNLAGELQEAGFRRPALLECRSNLSEHIS